MSVSHAVMSNNLTAYTAADGQLVAQLEAQHSTPEWATASPLQRAQAERVIQAERKVLADAFLERQRGFVDTAEAEWKAHMPTVLQRRAALDNPGRATAIRELTRGTSPAELGAIAEALVLVGDAAGGYGLRQSLAARNAEPGEDLGKVVARAREAGTAASQPRLRELLRARSVWAQSLGVVSGLANPAEAMTAADAAREVPMEDGTIRRFSDKELASLLNGDG